MKSLCVLFCWGKVLNRQTHRFWYVWPGRKTLSGKLAVLMAFGKFCKQAVSSVLRGSLCYTGLKYLDMYVSINMISVI